MDVTSDRFADATRQALADGHLQEVLAGVTSRFRQGRAAAFEAFPEGEALRDLAREVKARTIHRLDRHLERLADEFAERGGHVHFAADAEEARRIVVDLARQANARLAVKSKSMTTEEIDLNTALLEAGVETVETDLGEYILQLAGESPAHIIAPAIHKTRADVTELFAEKLGSPRLMRHEELTQEARRHLRAKFRDADLGITGVNFAVAETGTLVVVENEGNARLTTTLPRVHVAVMGMEKVVPDWPSLAVFLEILARSATGQKMSSYVSVLTGPRRPGEQDGPEETHLVILDNGRSRLLADPALREALYCIRCGACLNACPVYRRSGGHAYGWVYSGPIGAVIDPTLLGHRRAAPLPFASSLCGACREVCPVRIDLPRLLLEQRARVLAAGGGRLRERFAMRSFAKVCSSPRLYRLASRLLRLVSWPRRRHRPLGGTEGGAHRGWRPLFGAWGRERDLPVPPAATFLESWRRSGRG